MSEDHFYIKGCICREKECQEAICKGECGCKKCYDGYQDFLSWRGSGE